MKGLNTISIYPYSFVARPILAILTILVETLDVIALLMTTATLKCARYRQYRVANMLAN